MSRLWAVELAQGYVRVKTTHRKIPLELKAKRMRCCPIGEIAGRLMDQLEETVRYLRSEGIK